MPSDFWLSVRSAMYGATSTWGMRSEPCNSYPWGMGRCTADVISISIEVLLNVASLALHDGECELLQQKKTSSSLQNHLGANDGYPDVGATCKKSHYHLALGLPDLPA